jgi:hypothetical protein
MPLTMRGLPVPNLKDPGVSPDCNLTTSREGAWSASFRGNAGVMETRSEPRAGGTLGAAVVGAVNEAVAEAAGRDRRADPVLAHTGGPAGNALLTAWTALILLVGSIAELLTLVDINALISWHVAIGALLVPPALMKTASTGWRMARYYSRHRPYVEAGPPPLLLRLLGPLVVVSTLGLLGSGVLLVLLGPDHAHQALLDVLRFRVDYVTLHQGFFAVWVVATGLHLLGRIVPALRITLAPGRPAAASVPGALTRWLLLASVVVSAVALAVALVHADGSWVSAQGFDLEGH